MKRKFLKNYSFSPNKRKRSFSRNILRSEREAPAIFRKTGALDMYSAGLYVGASSSSQFSSLGQPGSGGGSVPLEDDGDSRLLKFSKVLRSTQNNT